MTPHLRKMVVASSLVDSFGWRHGSLDGQASNVLPSLLQQRDEVVDSQHDVTNQMILGHANVSDGNTQAKDLLQLELDGRPDIRQFTSEIFVMRNRGWEFSGLGQTRSQETWNLFDQVLGSDEGIVLPGELLDQLLVLVELLQVVNRHGVDSNMLGTIDIVLVTEDADAHVWSWDLWELDGARETLITLRIVVLQADLELDGLEEIALLGLIAVGEELSDVSTHSGD